MKNKVKGLLALALAAFTSLTWAAELVIPYTFDGKAGDTEYAYEYKVQMPSEALTSFTTTIRYTGGSHRVEILGVKLLDGETEYTAVATGTEGTEIVEEGVSYSGGNNYHNIFTFTNDAGFTANKVYTLQANLKVTNPNPSHRGNIKVSGGITLYAMPYAFGVNFTKDDSNVTTDATLGYATEGYAAPTAWTNVAGASGGYTSIAAPNAMSYTLTWSAHGGWNSGNAKDADAKKLLYGYLDDVASGARKKASVTITGLPADRKYAVAVILSGDGADGKDAFNNVYSPVLINGQTYSYDANGNLLTGEGAMAVTAWGDRRASASTDGTLTLGKNVMFVEDLSGSELTITSALDAALISRLTIAGIQVWISEETVTPTASASALPEGAEVISINFDDSNDGRKVTGSAGIYTVDGWTNISGASGSASSLTVSDGTTQVYQAIDFSFSSNNSYRWDSATDVFLKGYLDDGGNRAQVTLNNIPFEKYSVIVYTATDSGTNYRFATVQINNKVYIGTPYATSIGYAAEVEGMGAIWGQACQKTAAYGVNALRVDGLSGNLSIQGGSNANNARGGIAAIQIVNTGDAVMSDVQKIEGAAEQKISELPEIMKPVVELTLPAGATLIVDELPTTALTVISTGAVTIKVTDLSISQAQLDSMINTESVTGTVTSNFSETIGYTVGDVTYPLVYLGDTDGWSTAASWATGTRSNGEKIVWVPYSGTVVPGAPDSNKWNLGLIDGNLIGDAITADEDGYKVVNTPALEGWAFKITVANGVHVKVPTLNKLQGECIIRVDDSSKITVTNKGPGNNGVNNKYYIDAENGLVFENMPMPGGTAYLGATGSITTSTFANNQTIGGVTLDLGTPAEGRTVVTRTLYTYTAAPEFTINDGAVTTTDEEVEATEVLVLSNVGDYKFVKTDTAYQVQYVAYAETDELNAANVWNGAVDTAWETAGNWEAGVVPEANADVTITVAANTTLTIPAEGVTVGTLIVNGEGTLTLDGGKITAREIYANANIAASETTLALAPMNIAEGKTLTYTTTTTMADPDSMGASSHALSLKAMTGAGTFVKKGAGVIGLFATAAEPAIVVEEGAFYVREAPTTAMNIAAKAGAEIRLAAWHHNFANAANKIALDGGAQLTLANGANVSGTITIANAAETAAKICGSSFNDSTIAAAITGAGKVEFADGGTFGEGKYPCDGATTYTGEISGGLQVIISDTSAVTFTGAKTYTGGTVIAEGVTLNAGTGSLGTGAVTGAGKLVMNGYPENATVRNSLGAEAWTGLYVNTANNTMRDTGNWFGAVGNAGSSVEFSGTSTGYLAPAGSANFALIVSGSITFSDGNSSNGGYIFNGALLGTGTLATQNAQTDVLKFLGETKDFAGTITVAGGHCISFGDQDDDDSKRGMLVIKAGKTANIAAGKTWTAVNGIEVAGTIGGEGTIGSTLILLNGATLANAMTLEGNVTVAAGTDINHAYATAAGDTVIICANADAVAAALTGAPVGLMYVAEDGAVKLAAIPVAQIGEVEYATLGAAVEAAASGATITVLNDCTADTACVIANKTLTIDLNGKKVKANDTDAATDGNGVFWVKTGGVLTLNDSSEDKTGTVDGNGGNDYKMAIWADGGKVVINGGNYVNENDGTHTQYDLIYAKNGGEIVINGGTFKCDTPRWTLNSHNTNTGTFVVTGGKFYQYNPTDFDTDEAVTTWCDAKYRAEADGDWFVVKEGYTVTTEASAVTVTADTEAEALNQVEFSVTTPEGVDATAYKNYFKLVATETAEGSKTWTVALALKDEVKPVIAETTPAITFNENGTVTVNIENELSGLNYGVRYATTVEEVEAAKIVPGFTVTPAEGDTAGFFKVVVDFKEIK